MNVFNDKSMKTTYVFPLSLIVSLIFYFIKLIPLYIALLVTAEEFIMNKNNWSVYYLFSVNQFPFW